MACSKREEMKKEASIRRRAKILKRASWKLFERGKQLQAEADQLEADRLQREKEVKISSGDFQVIPAHSGKSKSQVRLDLEKRAGDLGLTQEVINTMTGRQIEAVLSAKS